MAQAFVGLGSNVGDRAATLAAAVEALARAPGIRIRSVSAFRETDPVGGPPQGRFLNAAAELETDLSPHALLAVLLDVEQQFGRVRAVRWGPRTLDLDLLLYDDLVLDDTDLRVPHPLMHEREFVLEPLAEIAPQAVHPALRATAAELLARLRAGRDQGVPRT